MAADLKQALQASLTARTSRIDVVLPPGAKLGTEKRPDAELAEHKIRAGDRELARILAAMFEKTGLNVRVVFETHPLQRAAAKLWGPVVECEIVSADAKQKRGKSKGGFGAASGGKKEKFEHVDVYIFVGGGAAFLEKATALAERVGMDKLVILANVNSNRDNLPTHVEQYWVENFECVYHYKPNPHPKWSGGVLFRKFPEGMYERRSNFCMISVPFFSSSNAFVSFHTLDWVLGRLTPIGTLQQLIVDKERPDADAIAEALSSEGDKTGNELAKKFSNFVDWMR